jgi:UDP-N-acetylmuramate: L-alanyl-gamma-D-glutamyl-meso-diaminopimelate ligase
MKHIHFIGICGVAMSALALACRKNGWKVTGSDKGFYPPVSTHLTQAGIAYYPGWHVDKMTANGNPNLVVVGNVAGSKNPEWLYVQKRGIPYVSYPEFIAKHMVKKTSIVCAGTYGKSTSSALLAWMFRKAGKNPTYMFGGIPNNDIPSAAITESDISILEGDEYKTARWDEKAKFFHYAPTHLLLTATVWDHADVYPTDALYVQAFTDLVCMLPKNGLVVVSGKVMHEQSSVTASASCQVVTYGRKTDNDYQYTQVQTSRHGVDFDIVHGGQTYHIHTDELGDYMADNMTGCFALAHQMGIAPKDIIQSMESFRSIKRRLEKKCDGDITVFDDIAHSPKKAEAVLRSLRGIFDGHMYAVYEPNSGCRQQESIPSYDRAFTHADTVIIPRLSTIKKDPAKKTPLSGSELAHVISQSHDDVQYIEHDDELVGMLADKAKKDDVIVFLGSHGFRGMIDDVVTSLRQQSLH